jgi:hypothetical protein
LCATYIALGKAKQAGKFTGLMVLFLAAFHLSLSEFSGNTTYCGGR